MPTDDWQPQVLTLDHIKLDDIASLTKEVAEISGITYVMDVDKEEVEKILESKFFYLKINLINFARPI